MTDDNLGGPDGMHAAAIRDDWFAGRINHEVAVSRLRSLALMNAADAARLLAAWAGSAVPGVQRSTVDRARRVWEIRRVFLGGARSQAWAVEKLRETLPDTTEWDAIAIVDRWLRDERPQSPGVAAIAAANRARDAGLRVIAAAIGYRDAMLGKARPAIAEGDTDLIAAVEEYLTARTDADRARDAFAAVRHPTSVAGFLAAEARASAALDGETQTIDEPVPPADSPSAGFGGPGVPAGGGSPGSG